MKKKSLLLFFLILSICSNAQINKQKFLVSGTFSFDRGLVSYTQKNPYSVPYSVENEYYHINFNPKIGYFLFFDRIALGLESFFDVGKTYIDSHNHANYIKSKTNLIGVFGRYYILRYRFTPYLDISFCRGKYLEKKVQSFSNDEVKQDIFSKGLGIGFCYFISKNITIDALFSATSYDYNNSDGEMNRGVTRIGVGLQYLFGEKQYK